MRVKDLIAKLRQFPPESDVVVQSVSEGEWGSFNVRSDVKSVVPRRVRDKKATVIRCADWFDSGGFS